MTHPTVVPGGRSHSHFMRHALATAGVLALCFSPSAAQGQESTPGPVRGLIVDSSGTPIGGALVELVGRGDSVRTSRTGAFAFARVLSGAEVLRIRALGHPVKFQNIRVIGDSGWIGTIVLKATPQRLPEIEVDAPLGKPPEFANTAKYDDFFRRRRLGIGTYRTRADIEKMGAFDVVSVLQGIPGVRVSYTTNPYGAPEVRFQMARCPGQPPNFAIYIDGSRVGLFLEKGQNKGSELSGLLSRGLERGKDKTKTSTCDDCSKIAEVLSSVLLRDIEFIEFYRGPGQIPSDLDRGDSCAALVIWTR